jgi:hypothetical protein
MSLGFYGRLKDAVRAFHISVPGIRGPAGFASRGKYSKLLQVLPRPLIDPNARIVVLFSPKSACTSVAIWFFHQLVGEAPVRALNDWPHIYRNEVYYQSDTYREVCASDLAGFKVIRVVRDPFERAASAYRHALRTLLAEREMVKVVGPDILHEGFSFDTYLTFLEQIDLGTCNPHFRPQRHPLEEALPIDYLINISRENLFGRLGDIERELGLKPTGPSIHEWVRDVEGRRYTPTPENFANGDSVVLTKKHARTGPWPRSQDLLTPRARERLAKLYAVDIRAYT